MMGFCQPVTNFKQFVSNNPPIVTFSICLLSLGISFVCLSAYSLTHTLPNPDTERDWNHVLSSLSQLHLCTEPRETSSEPITVVPSKQKTNRDTLPISVNMSSVTNLHLWVSLDVSASPARGSEERYHLYSTLRSYQLHLGGNESVYVTLELPSGNSTHTCLTISVPTHLLPESPRPPKCPVTQRNGSLVHVEVNNQQPSASQTCYSLHYKNDPALRILLTQWEQSVAARHQLEVSVVLLGVCLILCLVASLTGSLTCCYTWHGQVLTNEPLMDT